METLALRIMALEGEVNDPDILRDHTRLRDVCDELDDTRFHQDEVLAEWERLVEEQEAYEQRKTTNNTIQVCPGHSAPEAFLILTPVRVSYH